MRYFYDLEFIEDGKTIDLISIGIIAEDGREYYAVVSDAPWDRITNHNWLMENVVQHLPLTDVPWKDGGAWVDFGLDLTSTLVKPEWVIANEVREFIDASDRDVELWAYYGAYDHVCLMQLWGPMIAKPRRLPMWTHDIMQLAETVGVDGERIALPEQAGTAHNALHDARHVRDMWQALQWSNGGTVAA